MEGDSVANLVVDGGSTQDISFCAPYAHDTDLTGEPSQTYWRQTLMVVMPLSAQSNFGAMGCFPAAYVERGAEPGRPMFQAQPNRNSSSLATGASLFGEPLVRSGAKKRRNRLLTKSCYSADAITVASCTS